jgi:hypothetical protein
MTVQDLQLPASRLNALDAPDLDTELLGAKKGPLGTHIQYLAKGSSRDGVMLQSISTEPWSVTSNSGQAEDTERKCGNQSGSSPGSSLRVPMHFPHLPVDLLYILKQIKDSQQFLAGACS